MSNIITAKTIEELNQKYLAGYRNFSNCEFEDFNFIDMNLSGVIFDGVWFLTSTFTNCNLSNVTFLNSNLKYIDFTNVNLNGSKFNNCILSGSTFINCSLIDANFFQVDWFGTTLTSALFLESLKGNNQIL